MKFREVFKTGIKKVKFKQNFAIIRMKTLKEVKMTKTIAINAGSSKFEMAIIPNARRNSFWQKGLIREVDLKIPFLR